MFKTICLISTIVACLSAQALPTAIFHGLGDACGNAGMKQITQVIAEGMGTHVECIENAAGSLSVIENFENQAEHACRMIKANKNFQNTKFNVFGLSQGGLIARYIVESCDTDQPVNNMLTAGGPHMGVDKIPHCFNGLFCDLINSLAEFEVYSAFL